MPVPKLNSPEKLLKSGAAFSSEIGWLMPLVGDFRDHWRVINHLSQDESARCLDHRAHSNGNFPLELVYDAFGIACCHRIDRRHLVDYNR